MKSLESIKIKAAAVVALAMVVCISACNYQKDEVVFPPVVACDSVGVSFSQEVKPIIDMQCLSCHSISAAQGSVVLEQYSDYAPYTTSGRLVRAIDYSNPQILMPPSGKLAACDISKIRSWVSAGAPNN